MDNKNSTIILAKNIKMDKNYKNVLSYNNNDMVTLCRNNKVLESNDYSFLKPDVNQIKIQASYGTCVQANYIAFQNPYYSNKWFFAFIDKIEYKSETTQVIHYTIDEWTTWYGYWNAKPCFVIREHTNDDTIGANTINEGLELGDFICMKELDYDYLGFSICVALSDISNILVDDETYVPASRYYNGVASGLCYVNISDKQSLNYLIRKANAIGKIDAIVSIFMVPNNFDTSSEYVDPSGSIKYRYILQTNDFYDCGDLFFDIQKTTIGEKGFQPKNKKLFTYPYFFLEATNNCGVNVVYRYEDFSPLPNTSDSAIRFTVKGAISPGCSIKAIPNNYKLKGTDIVENYNESFNLGKLPLGSWINDIYTNWLRQNGLNMDLQMLNSVTQVATGAINKSAGSVISGVSGVANTINTYYQASLTPNQARGNVNSSDINFAVNKCGFTTYQKSIKDEYARKIDNYFTKYGYATNLVKIPNLIGRSNFNYVQIDTNDNIGYSSSDLGIPATSMEIINNIARNGVTIWHNYANFGDFSVDNSIV